MHARHPVWSAAAVTTLLIILGLIVFGFVSAVVGICVFCYLISESVRLW